MIEFWMLLGMLMFISHFFMMGFIIGKYYIRSYVDLQKDCSRPEWINEAIEAYRQSPRRPIGADELETIEWDQFETESSSDD